MEKQTTDPAADTNTVFRKQRTYGPASSKATFDMREYGRINSRFFKRKGLFETSKPTNEKGKLSYIREKNQNKQTRNFWLIA